MKIAIHNKENGFSKRWVKYCEDSNINFKIVNCFDNDIIRQVEDCDIVMWHFSHIALKDSLAAKSILFSLEHAGIKVFPDFKTAWHFDDKVAQKYLLEAINAPLVKSYVFYEKEKAEIWVNETKFPKVFKLKGGAGSQNVKLIDSKTETKKIINKAFGKGFKNFDGWNHFKENIRKYKTKLISFKTLIRAFVRAMVGQSKTNSKNRERGYLYFQDFIPNNNSDTRIIIVGKRAFGIKRMTRKGDFRASGSGEILYDKEEIDIRCINIAFDVAKKLETQNLAFDFVFDKNNKPLIIEISYGYSVKAYDKCPGYWDDRLKWHEGEFNPQSWMIEDLLALKN